MKRRDIINDVVGIGGFNNVSSHSFVMRKRGQLEWDALIPWLIGIGVLILVLILYFGLSGKGQAALTYLKSLLRFGR